MNIQYKHNRHIWVVPHPPCTFDGGRGRGWIGARLSAAVGPHGADSSLLLCCFVVFIQRHAVLEMKGTHHRAWVRPRLHLFTVTSSKLNLPLRYEFQSPTGSWSRRHHSTDT